MTIHINPDSKYVKEIYARLKANDYYCPCSLEKTQDTKCMCKEFRELKEGWCHCGLYQKTTEGKDAL